MRGEIMNKEEALKFYKEYNDKCNAYNLALSTMYFDSATIAPSNGVEYRTTMISILAGELFEYSTHINNINKLKEMSQLDLGEIMNKEIQLVLKDINKISLLPKEFYIKMQKVYAVGESQWRKAKEENNYSLFKDSLKEIVTITKQAYTYYGIKKSLYDDMLDDFETGMTIEKYDQFFSVIKDRLVPFIKEVIKHQDKINDDILHTYYPTYKQEKVMDVLKDYMGFNKDECYMGLSEHPFTSDFSLHDVRITTKYLEDALPSSIFSIIHEYGHALYALHVDEKMEGLNVSKAMTSGMHESQSRFLENYIGKRKSFWVNNYSSLQELFAQLKDVSLDEFIKMINISTPSLIRTEADELTYPLHILIRYELEKEMINGEVDYDTLNVLWADKYEQYLGIRPNDDTTGILQDIHWSDGSFGYFPTYALGSAFAAEFYYAMDKDIDIDKELENNHFDVIENWLKEHIHRYGALYNADEMIEKVCHKTFDPNVYIDYLIEKYSKLYEIGENYEENKSK
jgi:carboxypeptidase Taq